MLDQVGSPALKIVYDAANLLDPDGYDPAAAAEAITRDIADAGTAHRTRPRQGTHRRPCAGRSRRRPAALAADRADPAPSRVRRHPGHPRPTRDQRPARGDHPRRRARRDRNTMSATPQAIERARDRRREPRLPDHRPAVGGRPALPFIFQHGMGGDANQPLGYVGDTPPTPVIALNAPRPRPQQRHRPSRRQLRRLRR